MELSDQEREELMACEFEVVDERLSPPKIWQGRLVDIEFDIGITTVDKNNLEKYLICITSPDVGEPSTPEERAIYEPLFNAIVMEIKAGKLRVITVRDIVIGGGIPPGFSSSETCAFNR